MLPTRCPFCIHRNPQGARFCNECGSPLHLAPCAHCEAVNDVEARSCHRCGGTLHRDRDVELVAAGAAASGAVDIFAATPRIAVPTALSSWLDEVGTPQRMPPRPPPAAPLLPDPPSFGDEPSFSIDGDVDAQDRPRATIARPRNHRLVAGLALVLVVAGAGAGYLALRQAGYLAGTPFDARVRSDPAAPAAPSDAGAPGTGTAAPRDVAPATPAAPAAVNEPPEPAVNPSAEADPAVTEEGPRDDPAATDTGMRRPALPRADPGAAATDEVIARELRDITPPARRQARP